MKRKFLIANALLICLILVGDIFYILKGGLLIKSLTSAGFVLLGLLNFVFVILTKENDFKFSCLMFSGLFFAMLGDIILEIEFIIGAVLFAIGHLLFFVSYSTLIKFKWKDLIYGAIIFVPSVLFITLAPIFDFEGMLMEIVCVIYAIIISCMVGKSISNLIYERSLKSIVIVIGSILFFFSDLMLLLNVFGDIGRIAGILCLATYYPAECVLAYSIIESKRDKLSLKEKFLSKEISNND